MSPVALSPSPPMVFLAGPPGSGKTSLGQQACQRLGLVFLDLSRPAASADDPLAGRAELEAAIAGRLADVVALSSRLQAERAVLKLARQTGELLLLWAHPNEVQQRSGLAEPLFTPVGRLRTHGGFGRNGTSCREFRRLDQACSSRLLLVRIPLHEAAGYLGDSLLQIREDATLGLVEQQGMDDWSAGWYTDYRGGRAAADLIVEKMAAFTQLLESQGTSPRALSGVYSDLDVAGLLVFSYLAPKPKDVLDEFSSVPCEIEFERKMASSAAQLTRYCRTLRAFAKFLARSGATS